MTSSERRKAPRAVSQLEIVVGHDAQELAASTENISESGAYCTVSRFLPMMTKLQLRLEIPDGQSSKTLICQGVVVRIEPPQASPEQQRYRVAIFFNDLTARDRSVLAHYVTQRLQPTAS